MKQIYFTILAAIIFASCSTNSNLKTSQRKLNRQAEANATNTKIVNKPILADLEVGLKRETTVLKITNQDIASSILISGSTESKKANFLTSANETMKNEARNRAQFKFMEEFKCDYLIDPIYKIETESNSNSPIINITVEVYAYPGYYKRFSQPDSLPKSVFQLGALDSREIPLMTSSATNKKNDIKTESGFILGPSLNNIKKDENGNTLENTSAGIGGSLGFYTLFPIGEKFGFRSEYLISTKGFTLNFEDSSYVITGKTSYRYYSLDLPLMLNFKATSNINLHSGVSFNYTAIGRYKNDLTYYDPFFGNTQYYNDSGEITGFEGSLQAGFVLGGSYQTDGGFGIGLRQQFGLGKDAWNTSQLVISFGF